MDEKSKVINTTNTEKIADWLRKNFDVFTEDRGSALVLAKRIAKNFNNNEILLKKSDSSIISTWSQAALADGKITLKEALDLIEQLAAALDLPLEYDASKILLPDE